MPATRHPWHRPRRLRHCQIAANHATGQPGRPPNLLPGSGCAQTVRMARTRVWMIGVKDKIWFLREGLFAKYVISLVGLVVFVLAVNGAMETWISYRATKTTLTDAMAEKAEATARRIEQSVSELERQISWVTRASADDRWSSAAPTMRSCSTRCRRSASSPSSTAGPRAAAAVAHRRSRSTATPISPAIRDSPKPSPAASTTRRPISAARSPSCRSRCRIPASTPASPSPKSTCASCRTSSATPRSARPPSPMWSIRTARCWRARPRARRSARTSRRCRRSPP